MNSFSKEKGVAQEFRESQAWRLTIKAECLEFEASLSYRAETLSQTTITKNPKPEASTE